MPAATSTGLRLADNSPDHFPGALVHWADSLSESDGNKVAFDEAFKAIDLALLETASYLAGHEAQPNKTRERELSELWMSASRAVSSIDAPFADAMAYKGLGWANPAVLERCRTSRVQHPGHGCTDSSCTVNATTPKSGT